MIEIDVDKISKFIGKYSLGKDNGNESLHFLRIKIPGGVISADKFYEIAEMAEYYGRGYAEITNRQDIQLHWIDAETALEVFERLYKMGYTTDLCGQAFSKACHGDVRNIVSCPISGKASKDLTEYVFELNDYFSGNPEFLRLPHKFKIAFTSCGYDCVRIKANDLSLIWTDDGFVPFVGGGMGISHPGIRFAESLNVLIPEEIVFDFVKAVVEIYRDYSNKESKMKARFKNLVHSWGVEKLREKIEEKIGKLRDYRKLDLQMIEHRKGIQWNDLQYYTLPLLGTLNAEKMKIIAELSKEFGSGELRLTPWQNVMFTDVEDLDGLKDILSEHFSIKEYYTAIACPSNFCGRTTVHARDVLENIAEFGNVAVSGCANGCSCHRLADIGLVGKFKKGIQVYDLYIRGELVMNDLKPEEILKVLKEGCYEIKA